VSDCKRASYATDRSAVTDENYIQNKTHENTGDRTGEELFVWISAKVLEASQLIGSFQVIFWKFKLNGCQAVLLTFHVKMIFMLIRATSAANSSKVEKESHQVDILVQW
jgi:hypothetical protein